MRKLISRSILKLNKEIVGYRYEIIYMGFKELSLDIPKRMHRDFELLLGIGNIDLSGFSIEGFIKDGMFVTNDENNVVEVKDLDHAKRLIIENSIFYEKIFNAPEGVLSLEDMLSKGNINVKVSRILNSLKDLEIAGVSLEDNNGNLELKIYASKVSDIFRFLIYIYKGDILNINVKSNNKDYNLTVDTKVTKIIKSLRAINKQMKFIDAEDISGVINDFIVSSDEGLYLKTIIS